MKVKSFIKLKQAKFNLNKMRLLCLQIELETMISFIKIKVVKTPEEVNMNFHKNMRRDIKWKPIVLRLHIQKI